MRSREKERHKMENTSNKISVIHNSENNLCKYDSQYDVQSAFVELDCAGATLSSTYNSEIGNAVPFSVWHNRELRFGISPYLKIDAINTLLDEIAPLAQRVVDGYEEEWDGSNYIGTYTDDAEEAKSEIESICDSADDIFNYFTWMEYLECINVLDELAQCESVEDFKSKNEPDNDDDIITGDIIDVIKDAIEYAKAESQLISLPKWVWKIEECVTALNNGWDEDTAGRVIGQDNV